MASVLPLANVVLLNISSYDLFLQESFDEDNLDDLPPLESVHPNDTVEPKVDYYYLTIIIP